MDVYEVKPLSLPALCALGHVPWALPQQSHNTRRKAQRPRHMAHDAMRGNR